MKSLLEIPHIRRKSNLLTTGTTTRHAEKLDTSDQLIHIHIHTAYLSILKVSVTLDMKHGIKKNVVKMIISHYIQSIHMYTKNI